MSRRTSVQIRRSERVSSRIPALQQVHLRIKVESAKPFLGRMHEVVGEPMALVQGGN